MVCCASSGRRERLCLWHLVLPANPLWFSARTVWGAVKTHMVGWFPQASDLHLPCKQTATDSLRLLILGGVTSATGLEERLKTRRKQ